ncbi:MAG: hypothetical protein ACK5X3_00025 [Pseudomonadota bacterium]|jgi:hypothetical protein
MTDYEALKLLGHTPAKAHEIILDAKRGDDFSREYVAWAHSRLAQLKQKEATK